MIFLAVTMGFFAESMHEHFTEKKEQHAITENFTTRADQ